MVGTIHKQGAAFDGQLATIHIDAVGAAIADHFQHTRAPDGQIRVLDMNAVAAGALDQALAFQHQDQRPLGIQTAGIIVEGIALFARISKVVEGQHPVLHPGVATLGGGFGGDIATVVQILAVFQLLVANVDALQLFIVAAQALALVIKIMVEKLIIVVHQTALRTGSPWLL